MRLSYGSSIDLSVYDIEAILKDYLLREEGFKVESISHSIVSEVCGLGDHKRPCNNLKGMVFHGSSVDASPQTTYREGSSLARQISDIESGNVVER